MQQQSNPSERNNPSLATAIPRGRKEWIGSVHGEAMRIGRYAQANWDAFTPPAHKSGRRRPEEENPR